MYYNCYQHNFNRLIYSNIARFLSDKNAGQQYGERLQARSKGNASRGILTRRLHRTQCWNDPGTVRYWLPDISSTERKSRLRIIRSCTERHLDTLVVHNIQFKIKWCTRLKSLKIQFNTADSNVRIQYRMSAFKISVHEMSASKTAEEFMPPTFKFE